MSLALNQGTLPANLDVKTYPELTGLADIVWLGEYEISVVDFLAAAEYVLTNTDIRQNGSDPRIEFVDRVKWMNLVPGYNTNRQRLGYNRPRR